METYVKQNFEGYINGVLFTTEPLFEAIELILEEIEYEFGEIYNNEFIQALAIRVEDAYYYADHYTYESLRNEIRQDISKADKFEEIKFNNFEGYCETIDFYNNLIKGHYTKKVKLTEEIKKIIFEK